MSDRLRRLKEIAATLHSDGDSLETSLGEDDITLLTGNIGVAAVEGEKLRFFSMEARNQFAAKHHLDSLGESPPPADVFSAAHKIYIKEHSASDKVSGRLLAMYGKGTDLLLTASHIISNEQVRKVFDILYTIQAALPYLDQLSADGLIALCRAQFQATRRDLASGMIFRALQDKLQGCPTTCEAVLNSLRIHMSDDAGPMYGCATRAWATVNPADVVRRVLEDCRSTNSALAGNAVWALGLLASDRIIPAELELAAWQILEISLGASEPGVRRAAIMSIELALEVWPEGAHKLLELASIGDDAALFAVSRALLHQPKTIIQTGLFEQYLNCLSTSSVMPPAAVEHFDLILANLIKSGQTELAVAALEKWIIQYFANPDADKPYEKLNTAYHTLCDNKTAISNILTRWLCSPDMPLARAAADMASMLAVHDVGDINFDTSCINEFDAHSFLQLVRRMIGYIYSEKILIPLTFSLLTNEIVERHGEGILRDLLVNEVGMDYPEEVLANLKRVKAAHAGGCVPSFCEKAISDISSYFSALSELPRLNELRPPTSWERHFLKAQNTLMEKLQERSNDKSVLRSIMTVVPLKAGRASFSRFDGKYAEPTQLGSVTASCALPRRHSLDAVGYEIHLLYLRSSRKEE